MKNKLMGIIALASCVVLSGCGDKSKDIKIEINTLPTDLVEGDKIDLKDYIVVSGGQGAYSINFDDESFAKITKESETAIVCNEYGNVKFTVDYSGKSVEGILVVGSAFLNSFVEDVNTAGYDYGIIYYDEYDYIHFDNYGEKFVLDQYYSDDAMGGYLEGPDGVVYSFELSYDEEDPVFDFYKTGSEPDNISESSAPLSLPVAGYEVSKDEYQGEQFTVLTLNENEKGDVRNIFLDFFKLDGDSLDEVLDYYGLEVSSFQVMEDYLTLTDGTTSLAYDTYAMARDKNPASETFGEEFYIAEQVLTTDDNLFATEDVQAYIDSGKQPASKYSLDVDAIAAEINKHNYTVSYNASWYDCSVSEDGTRLVRGAARSDNPFVTAEALEEEGYMIHDFYNAIGGFDVYISGDKTFSDVPHEDGYGLINHDVGEGVIEAYEYSGNDVDGYNAKKESTGFSIYAKDNDYFYHNYQFLTGAKIDEYPSVYEGMFINDKTVNKDGSIVYSLSGATCVDLFDCLFLESVFDGAYPEDYVIGHFDSINKVARFILEQGMEIYLDVEITAKFADDALVGVSFDFAWTDAEVNAAGTAYDYYQYVMSASLDFTSCDMPVFDVNFPA